MLRPSGRCGLAVGLGAVLIFSACSGADAEGNDPEAKDGKGNDANSALVTPVSISNYLFAPQEIQVTPGTKVTWTNQDDAPHNVQDLSELNTPISPDLNKDETFSIRYTNPGSYPYLCGLHTYMTGTVKVT